MTRDDATFDEWMTEMRSVAERNGYACGVEWIDAWDDDSWRESYDAGETPKGALDEALTEANRHG